MYGRYWPSVSHSVPNGSASIRLSVCGKMNINGVINVYKHTHTLTAQLHVAVIVRMPTFGHTIHCHIQININDDCVQTRYKLYMMNRGEQSVLHKTQNCVLTLSMCPVFDELTLDLRSSYSLVKLKFKKKYNKI